jgi:hypothetical protein
MNLGTDLAMENTQSSLAVIPAMAGIQKQSNDWTPASAGVTKEVEQHVSAVSGAEVIEYRGDELN